jgi:hypothetical protein
MNEGPGSHGLCYPSDSRTVDDFEAELKIPCYREVGLGKTLLLGNAQQLISVFAFPMYQVARF